MSRWVQAIVLSVALCAGWGCASPDTGMNANWLQSMRANAICAEHAIFEVALIERPLGDAYLNDELWGQVDEFVVDLEKRSVLNDNGLRVGLLGGSPPAEFQALLLSKRSNANPQAMLIPVDKKMPMYLGPQLPACEYTLELGGEQKQVRLDQARFCLEVTPKGGAKGETLLRMVPRVEHGQATLPFEPAADGSGWAVSLEKPNHTYADLGWEVPMSPNHYLIVGTRFGDENSLGHSALTGDDVQRLLVIRCVRGPQTSRPTDSVENFLKGKSLPLAIQASQPFVRAKNP